MRPLKVMGLGPRELEDDLVAIDLDSVAMQGRIAGDRQDRGVLLAHVAHERGRQAGLVKTRTLGFHCAISEMPAPYDVESLERLVGHVKPLVGRG